MSLKSRSEGQVVILEWIGQLGVDNFAEFKDGVDVLISRGSRHFIFDMSGVSFIDSRGLGVISGFFRKAKNVNGNFVLAALQEDVKPIFEITGLKKYCTIVNTVSDALRTFNPPRE